MKDFLKRKPAFILLLPLFFVLHGYVENFNHIPVKDAIILTSGYLIVSLVICIAFWFLFRNLRKAALVTVLIMSWHFFFGTIHDSIVNIAGQTFFTKYTFILPFSLVIVLAIIILLKKSRRQLYRITAYLNFLLGVLIIIDLGWLVIKAGTSDQEKGIDFSQGKFIYCDTCARPDIYLIVLDEYPGKKQLQDQFSFDNSGFEIELKKRGFNIIPNSRSNYHYTPYSIASTLSMGYPELDLSDKGRRNVLHSYEVIKNNEVMKLFQAHGYQFHNFSIFNFPGKPARTFETFLPNNTKLVTSQTFLSRLNDDVRFNTIQGKFKVRKPLRKYFYDDLRNNNTALLLTRNLAAEKKDVPVIAYSHLMMPHFPYYFNSKGEAQPFETLIDTGHLNKKNFLEYLLYTNKTLLALVDDIRSASASPPVIILMSDHGFRHTRNQDPAYLFMTLNAVYFPNGNYLQFYEGMTNVNQFRVILNAILGQRFPLLKDSIIHIRAD